jgi:hypothetical protein
MEDHFHHSMENDEELVKVVSNFAGQIELDLPVLVEVVLDFGFQIELDLIVLVEVVSNFAVQIESYLIVLLVEIDDVVAVVLLAVVDWIYYVQIEHDSVEIVLGIADVDYQ